jgi:predicted DNA-binding protein
MLCCMSGATRTQIYLSAEQRDALDARAQVERKTLAHVIRDAVDRYLAEDMDVTERDLLLAETFGTCPELGERVPSRNEWERNPTPDHRGAGRGVG